MFCWWFVEGAINRVAWISKSGFESLTGENKDFVVYIGNKVNIYGGSDGVHDGYITNYEGNVTKEDFAVGDEINLDVTSGSITLTILELKWSLKHADWLEMVKVDYEIESEEALSADFSIEPSQNINLGDVVTFDVSSSTGDISSYDWDFGDGGKFSLTSENKHFYMSSGTFPVTLTVKDNNGNSDSLTKTVNVNSKYDNSELKISLVSNMSSQILVNYRVVLTKNAPLNVNVEKYSNGDGLPGVIVGSAFQNDAIMCAIPDIPKMVTSKCINYIIKEASKKADKILGPIGWISNMIDLAAYIECIQGYNFIEDDKTAGDGNLIIHIPYESAELRENKDISDETQQMSEAFLDKKIKDKIFETDNLQFQKTPEQLIYIDKENTGLSKKTVNQQKFVYMKKIDPSALPEGITFYYEPLVQKKENVKPSHPKLEISVKRQIKNENIPLIDVSICIIVNDMCQSIGSTSSDGSLRLTEDELVHIDPHGTYTLVAGDGIFYSRKKKQFTFNNEGTTHVDIVLDKKELPTIPSYIAIFAKTPQEYPNIVTYPHATSIKNFLQNNGIYTEYIDPTNSEIRKNPTTLNEKMQAIISGSDWIIVLCSFEDIQKPFADFNPYFKFSADKKKPENVLKEGTEWKIIKYTSETIGLSGETSQHLYYIVTEDKTNAVETAVKEFFEIMEQELGGSGGLDQLISASINCSANLHAYDSQGRHVGVGVTGGIDLEIPDASYTGPDSEPESIIIPNQSDNIIFKVEALDTGEFDFTLTQITGTKTTIVSYLDVPITQTTEATVDVSKVNPTYTMEIDDNSDGVADREKKPTNITVSGSQSIFDTRASANPYPSLSGTHTGTITQSQDIYVSELYTYPCAGTGGHTESVRIYGNDLDESASWNDYAENGDTITFDSPFTLEAGKTYNYVIITGSYPQIHHTKELQTDYGWLNCTKFTDANGKEHDDWIPAIRLGT